MPGWFADHLTSALETPPDSTSGWFSSLIPKPPPKSNPTLEALGLGRDYHPLRALRQALGGVAEGAAEVPGQLAALGRFLAPPALPDAVSGGSSTTAPAPTLPQRIGDVVGGPQKTASDSGSRAAGNLAGQLAGWELGSRTGLLSKLAPSLKTIDVAEPKLLAALSQEGGATLTPDGDPFAGSGYAVADPALTTVVKTPEEMQSFLRRPDVSQALASGKHIGKWTDPATGATEINITDIHPDQKAALKVAAQRGEQAIGHIQNGEYQGDIANPHAPVPAVKALVAQMNGGKIMPRVTEIPADKGQMLAQAYEALPKNDPAAKSSYDALNAEIAKQKAALADAGIHPEFVSEDPYKNSGEMMADVRAGKPLKVFKTPSDNFHPYMTPAQNDDFRFVHDALAHAGGGNQFGAVGEENAYRVHASTLSPEAQRALATETRGQNSWVNFGPNAHLPVTERPFAEQKAALWPQHLLGDYDRMVNPHANGAVSAGAEPEKITGAAIKVPGGKYYEGVNHPTAIENAVADGAYPGVSDLLDLTDAQHGEIWRGFHTTSGRYVDMHEGGLIGKRAQQLSESFDPRLEAMSEDFTRQGSGFAPKPIEAPNLNLDTGGNVIPLDVSINPAGVDASRPAVLRPPRADLSVLEGVKRRIRDVYTPAAEKGLKENPLGAAWYDLSPLKKIFEQESPTGAEDFNMFTSLLGPTSAGTDVPQNIRQASLFYKLWKEGQLTPEAIRGKQLDIPAGYGNRLNIREPLARVVEQGQLDPLRTPKTFRYSQQLGGKSWGGTALDRHVGYNVGLLGSFEDAPAAAGSSGNRGFPQPSYARDRAIQTSPTDTHYAAIEDAMIREAEKLGVHPAAYQAAGWVGNAEKTGVADARHPLEIINGKLGETAKRYGYASRMAALRAFIRGQTPLWALGGLAAGAGGGLLSEDGPPDEGR